MNEKDVIQPARIAKVTLFVYEGELEYDVDGNITSKLRETHEYTRSVETVEEIK